MEKHYLTAIFEVVLNIGILIAAHLHNQLVERVVVAAPHSNGPPAVAAFHLAPKPNGLGLPLKLVALGVAICHKQRPLLLQFQYR